MVKLQWEILSTVDSAYQSESLSILLTIPEQFFWGEKKTKHSSTVSIVSKISSSTHCVGDSRTLNLPGIWFHVQPKLGLMGWQDLTCMRFMASRIWSRWWAELRASRRMSVNFSSFSRSSFFSWSTISASASVHSHSLQFGIKQGGRTGRVGAGHLHSYSSPTRTRWSIQTQIYSRERVKDGVSKENRSGRFVMKVGRELGRLRWQLIPV